MQRSILTAAIIGPSLVSSLLAQAPDTAALLRRARFESRILGEVRAIDVALPRGYAVNTDRRYPVLVVLDGETTTELAAALARFYASVGQLPEMIVVGIPNTDRTRDLSPAPVAGFTPPADLGDTFGGADRFLSFLADELLRWVDREYRTAPLRALIGHSVGGTFALYALAHRPEAFTGYVVMEPATWWNNQKEVRDAGDALAGTATRRARLMLVNAPIPGADTTHWGGDAPMVRQFSTTGETHVSMPAVGLTMALRAMFADFRPTPWRPGTRPIAMLERYDSLQQRVGYAPPIPEAAFTQVIRMSLDSRFFDDAETALARLERTMGASAESRRLRDRLAVERTQPPPAGFVPLEIPAHRPTAREAAAFLGRWEATGRVEGGTHRLDIRASGDTITVFSHAVYPGGGPPDEAYWPVIQVTADGTLEIGSPWLRGVAGLLVFKCWPSGDGTLVITRENRGFRQPSGPGAPDYSRPLVYRRLAGGPTS